jgi:hypothetical protein
MSSCAWSIKQLKLCITLPWLQRMSWVEVIVDILNAYTEFHCSPNDQKMMAVEHLSPYRMHYNWTTAFA